MRILFISSFIIFATLMVLLGLALFDVVNFDPTLHGIFGVGAVVTLCIAVKAFIRVYKSTRRF